MSRFHPRAAGSDNRSASINLFQDYPKIAYKGFAAEHVRCGVWGAIIRRGPEAMSFPKFNIPNMYELDQ
jgi:hypothetical protein